MHPIYVKTPRSPYQSGKAGSTPKYPRFFKSQILSTKFQAKNITQFREYTNYN
jgi:hypothetical protein